jgi:hypothetical protein
MTGFILPLMRAISRNFKDGFSVAERVVAARVKIMHVHAADF